MTQTVSHRPLAPLGAEITGVDLSKDIEPNTIEEILRILHERGVILFRNQNLQDEDMLRFGRKFGYDLEKHLLLKSELMIFSNMLKDGKPVGLSDGGQFWHSDGSHSVPHMYTILYGVEIPHDANGEPLGDTLFSSTTTVYDDLPADLKKKLNGVQGVFKFDVSYRKRKEKNKDSVAAPEQLEKPPVLHPVCRPHPMTGKKSIFVNEGYVTHLEGLPRAEGDAILKDLLERVKADRYVYRHRWKKGDLLMWDNSATQHCAVPDYRLPQTRLMKRIVLKSSKSGVPA